MIGFAFCHGWGFDADTLEPLMHALGARFPTAQQACFDLGFTGRPRIPDLLADYPAVTDWIAIGHSYGFAYLMQRHMPWKAAIAINGFSRFCRRPGQPEGTPASLVNAMLKRLHTEPHATVADFYQRCGSRRDVPAELAMPVLDEHLACLRDLDLVLPTCPLLVLWSTGDKVVPPSLTHACFPQASYPSFGYEGSHMHLLEQPAACIDTIAQHVEPVFA